MDTDRKTKSFSLESPEPEDSISSSQLAASGTAYSVTDLKDNDFEALLNMASLPKYQKRNVNTDDPDTGQITKESSDGASASIPLSKDAQNILADLRVEAERDKYCEDEAAEIRFDQKKLGKSASHESCQSRWSGRGFHGRHATVEVDTGFDSCLFGGRNDENAGIMGAVNRNNFRRSSRSDTAPLPVMDDVRSGCRSPGAGVALRQNESHFQRGLNRSYSSTGGGGPWTNDTTTVPEWTTVDDCLEDKHRFMAKALNKSSDRGLRSLLMSHSMDGNRSLMNREMGDMQEMQEKPFDKLSLDLITPRSGVKKQRSSSQHGQNTRRSLKQDGRMTQSEMVPKFGQRRNRMRQDDRGIMSEQLNGFRGRDDLDKLLDYIEGADASKKCQSDQQTKRAKKKCSSESGANMNNNNNNNGTNPSYGNSKKEKIRRSTEGDDGTSAFAALKSGNAAAGGPLSYKHRSTDSLGLSFNEDDRRPFGNVGKSTSSDDGMGGRALRDEILVGESASENAADVRCFLDADAMEAQRLQEEELREALANWNTSEDASNLAALLGAVVDDEQFIPVTNKKQKKNKSEQFRTNAASRCGRNPRNRALGEEHTKRSVTPPARESAATSGRRRRNSLDYSRVTDRITSSDLKRAPADSIKDAIVTKLDSGEGTPSGGVGAMDESTDANKPSYANVAAAHRHLHPPILGDYVTRATANKQRLNKKRSSNYAGARDNRTTRDDGASNRQAPRQTSSLNASRSSSPVNIPTAVATNLANASSPDLKHFTGDSLTSSGQPPRRTYATIAADRRPVSTSSVSPKVGASAIEIPPISAPTVTEKENSTTDAAPAIGIRKSDNGQNVFAPAEEDLRKVQSDSAVSTVPGDFVCETTDANSRKCVTDSAVNIEPITATAPTTSSVTTTNLGESAFIFEQVPSTSETFGVVFRKAGDRSSCSGVFDLPDPTALGKPHENEEGDSRTNSVSVGTSGNSRERRNSCPVQFLDKAGASFDAKSLNASGLTFVYGDEEESDIQGLLDISGPNSGEPTKSTIEDRLCENSVRNVDVAQRPQAAATTAPPSRIPEKALRDMVDYANKAWNEFTHGTSSTIYYKTMDNH